MARNILYICTDQQRYDSLGCNGGKVARTPTLDNLASNGINYRRAHPQNVICMPSRASMITGQLVRSHGVYASGVALPEEAPTVIPLLADAGYQTACIGKAHWEPIMEEVPPIYTENRLALDGSTGPYRGFDHVELGTHLPSYLGRITQHYGDWVSREHPEELELWPRRHFDSERLISDTGAPETSRANHIPREHYHTDWLADRAIAWLKSLPKNEKWFLFLSFPDPHHPLNPPSSELDRVDWRDLDLPAGYPTGGHDQIVEILSRKPRHWLREYERNASYAPPELSEDQVREFNAMVHIENELIDEAVGRVLDEIGARGWDDDTDIFFTTDHGDLQGDFGLLFKGPFHVDGLMRLPLIWRPAPSAGIAPSDISEPVGLLDLAPTWCKIAGVEIPEFMDGVPLPTSPGTAGRRGVITEFDSVYAINANLRTICLGDHVCTVYERIDDPARDEATRPVREMLDAMGFGSQETEPLYNGDEGELYDLIDDPLQQDNLWDDPRRAALKRDLIAELYDSLPPPHQPELPCRYMG